MDINYAFDIDMIATELENAANLLRCFYEFWDEEGNSDTKGLGEENKALIFLKRMPQYISTVYAAIDMIDSQKNNLDDLSNKIVLSNEKAN